MKKQSLEILIQGLNDARVRYLVVGGLAVNAHGYMRLTVDVDLIIHLDSDNVVAAMAVLKQMGYIPKVPVVIEDFADSANRARWMRDKHMSVFGLRSEQHPETDVDIFVNDPLGFEQAYERAELFPVSDSINMPVCSYEDLVKLKRQAGRPKDLLDLQQLQRSRGEI